MSNRTTAYKEAGVDVEAGYEGVRKIKPLAEATAIPGVMSGLGSFGALFDLKELHLQDPVLVSGTDGVGTKLLLAIAMNRHDTVGIDCVAMCANDVLAQGAFPIFFLDYIALGKNDPSLVESIVKGVAQGCLQAECALIGGETAEMPGVYAPDHYDLAGFCVGAAERNRLIDGSRIRPGDVLIGISSSGVHSNGFSLVRKIIRDHDLDLAEKVEGKMLGEWLLEPTRIYVKDVKAVLKEGIDILGMAHITGGGFYENLPRMIPDSLGMEIDGDAIERPFVFGFLQEKVGLSDDEMAAIFNMGIGFVLCIREEEADRTLAVLNRSGKQAIRLGRITDHPGVEIRW